MSVNKLLVGGLIVIVIFLGGISAGMAEPSQYSFIANDFAQHTSFLASNVEWHAAAIAAIKYLNTKDVATRYRIDPRSVQRRVKELLLPPPVYLGTRYPRWSLEELDAHDRKIAMLRVPNRGALAAAAKRAAKSAADKTDAEAQAEDSKSKAKPTVKPAGRPRGRPRRAAASTNEMMNT
jgi:hypothetical protein